MSAARIFTFDPTTEPQLWRVEGAAGELLAANSWPGRTAGAAGTALIEALAAWQPIAADTLRVVRGPGSYGAVRTAALVANAAAWQIGCRLQTRLAHETEWQTVATIQPFYAAPPAITLARPHA